MRTAVVSTDSPAASRSITANARYIVSLTATAGLALTLLFNSFRSLEPAYQNRSLHVAKETAAALVLLLVAALLFGRFRRSGRLLDLLALAGVVVLAGKNLVFSVLTAILTETSGGLTTWRTTGAGMLGAGLLAASALAPERVVRDRRRALAMTTAGCIAALGVLIVIADVFELPAAFTERPETRTELQYLSQNTALLIADIGATALFLLAGAAFGRRAERERDEFQLWLGMGSTIAGIAYLNYVLFPSAYTDFLYVGDIFRVAAVVAWGIGTIRVISAYQEAYARAAVLEERRRVARDIHDGVAQELSFIASQMRGLPTREARPRDRRRDHGVGRSARSTSRAAPSPRSAGRSASRCTSRSPARPRRSPAVSAPGSSSTSTSRCRVPPAWEEALPRILREAVANAVRHGRARTVTVHLRDADGIWLRVTDDGNGFDVADVPDTSFGLIGMKERAESLGGDFKVSSEPGRGTSVEVLLP